MLEFPCWFLSKTALMDCSNETLKMQVNGCLLISTFFSPVSLVIRKEKQRKQNKTKQRKQQTLVLAKKGMPR